MDVARQRRSRNFTEREKILLIEIAKEFAKIIDNKKTDGATVSTKKAAWRALTAKYNAISESGPRTDKQLHALYDNLKKMARKNMKDDNNDKDETYKTEGSMFCLETTEVDEKVVVPVSPQFSSAAFYDLDVQTKSEDDVTDDDTTPQLVTPCSSNDQEVDEINVVADPLTSRVLPIHPETLIKLTPQHSKTMSSVTLKRKAETQSNLNLLTAKKIELLQLQIEQEKVKLKKTKELLDIDLELKLIQLESSKIDLEIKKKLM